LPVDYLIGNGRQFDRQLFAGRQFDWRWVAGPQFMFQSRIFLI